MWPACHSLATPGQEVHGRCPTNVVRDATCQLELFRRYTTARPHHSADITDECVCRCRMATSVLVRDTHPTVCKVAAPFSHLLDGHHICTIRGHSVPADVDGFRVRRPQKHDMRGRALLHLCPFVQSDHHLPTDAAPALHDRHW